jgi:hypothetical protein
VVAIVDDGLPYRRPAGVAAASLVTLARTGVDFDYGGNVIDAHAPEMPTRFAKQLTQIVRGGVAIGLERGEALRLAIRCARDSMPPLRLAIVDDVGKRPGSTPTDVRRRLNKPWTTIDRQMQALHMLGVLDVDEAEEIGVTGKPTTRWYYSLAEGITPEPIKATSPDLATPLRGDAANGLSIERRGDIIVTMITQGERCANRGCNRLLADTTVITTRDGRRFCKKHGDRLSQYVHRSAKSPRKASSPARA